MSSCCRNKHYEAEPRIGTSDNKRVVCCAVSWKLDEKQAFFLPLTRGFHRPWSALCSAHNPGVYGRLCHAQYSHNSQNAYENGFCELFNR
jgi:hypothetical protein